MSNMEKFIEKQPTEKTCSNCGETKPLSEFRITVQKNTKSGFYEYKKCKSCEYVYKKQWRIDNRDRVRIQDAFRHARRRDIKAGLIPTYTHEDFVELFDTFDTCAVCGGSFSDKEVSKRPTVDHLTPVSHMAEGTKNGIENFIVTHLSCNSQRGNRPIFRYFYDCVKEGETERFPSENFAMICTFSALKAGKSYSERFAELENEARLYAIREGLDELRLILTPRRRTKGGGLK